MKTFLVNVKDRRRRAEHPDLLLWPGRPRWAVDKPPSLQAAVWEQPPRPPEGHRNECSAPRIQFKPGISTAFTIITKNNAAVTGFYLGHVHNGKNKILQPCNQQERLQDCISCVMNWEISGRLKHKQANSVWPVTSHFSIFTVFSQGCLTHTCCKAWSCS